MAKKTDTSDSLSSDDLKQQLEETEVTEEAASEEVVEEETAEPVEEASEEQVETSEEPEETPEPKKEEKPLHRIKVEGKEEEIPYEKLIEFAQKGRHYEKEMSKLKEERRRLQEASPTTTAPVNQMPMTAEAKEQFFKALADDPFGTLGTFLNMGLDMREKRTKEERQADRLYESEQAENPLWDRIRPRYRELLDSGYSRQQAHLMAENDLLKDVILQTKSSAMKEGSKKEQAKLKAQMPVGEKRGKVSAGATSDADLSKLQSSKIAELLTKRGGKRIRNPGW